MDRLQFRADIEKHRATEQAKLDAERAERQQKAEQVAPGVLDRWIAGKVTASDARVLGAALCHLAADSDVAKRLRDAAECYRQEAGFVRQIDEAEQREREYADVQAQVAELESKGIAPAGSLVGRLATLGGARTPDKLRTDLELHRWQHRDLYADVAGVEAAIESARMSARKIIRAAGRGAGFDEAGFGQAYGTLIRFGQRDEAEAQRADAGVVQRVADLTVSADGLSAARVRATEARKRHKAARNDEERDTLGDELGSANRALGHYEKAADELARLKADRADLFAEKTPSAPKAKARRREPAAV